MKLISSHVRKPLLKKNYQIKNMSFSKLKRSRTSYHQTKMQELHVQVKFNQLKNMLFSKLKGSRISYHQTKMQKLPVRVKLSGSQRICACYISRVSNLKYDIKSFYPSV